MKAEQEKNDGKVELPPAILVRVDAIDQYEECEDPAGLGKILFAVVACLRGDDRLLPGGKDVGFGYMFKRLYETAKNGIVKCRKRTDSARKAAAARGASGKSPKGVGMVKSNDAEQGDPNPTSAPSPAPISTFRPQPMKDVQQGANNKTTETHSDGRGGVTRMGDCLETFAMGGEKGETFADRAMRDPYAATLEFTGEVGGDRTKGVYSKYLRQLKEQYVDVLITAYSEAKNGEWDKVEKRGAVLVDRFKKHIDGRKEG